MPSRTISWVPRHDLELPTELLHKITVLLLADCVHAVCMSTQNPTWEKSVLDTLGEVSPLFQAISCDVVAVAFFILPDVRKDNRRVQQVVRAKFVYLRHLCHRFGEDTSWQSNIPQMLNPSSDPFTRSYATLLSCISLRRSIHQYSNVQLFETIHKVVLVSLAECERLAQEVHPFEITHRLRQTIATEVKLSNSSVALLQSLANLNSHAKSIRILGPDERLIYDVHPLVHFDLVILEDAYVSYMEACGEKLPEIEPMISEFPESINALRGLYTSDFKLDLDERFGLGPRLHKLLGQFSSECPFLNPK